MSTSKARSVDRVRKLQKTTTDHGIRYIRSCTCSVLQCEPDTDALHGCAQEKNPNKTTTGVIKRSLR